MKTGIELIAEERKEQIEKHGYSIERDRSLYKKDELFQAASFCLELKSIRMGLKASQGESPVKMLYNWPDGWDKGTEDRIRNKPRVQQLIIAGAFLMANQDLRKDQSFHKGLIMAIGAEIENLQNS